MKISQLIADLQAVKDRLGDLPIYSPYPNEDTVDFRIYSNPTTGCAEAPTKLVLTK